MAKFVSKRMDVSKGAFVADATVPERVRAAFATLTSTHQHIVGYVLVNPFRAATMCIDEFAVAVDIPIATANRFASALGFDGCPQFRAELLRDFKATLVPVERLRHELVRSASSAEIFAALLNENIANLDATRRMFNATAYERAVDAILGAQHIYVMSSSVSSYLAGLLRHGFDLYRDTMITVSQPGGASDAVRQLCKIGPKDLLVAIALPRYAADAITLAKWVGKQGCQLLVLTDSLTLSLASLANVTLHARPERQLSVTSDTVVVALFEALCSAMMHHSVRSLESAERPTESILSWLYTVPAPRINDASGASSTPTTTRHGRKRAVESQLTSSRA